MSEFLLGDAAPAASSGTAATQADQETSTSTVTYVSPGRQQFHPSAAKCWAYVTVAAGTPTLTTNYNITSITDTGLGQLTITIATDFSTANWAGHVSTRYAGGVGSYGSSLTAQAAGTCTLEYVEAGAAADPVAWHFMGFGDQ